jgi:hypothetical protein
VKLKNTDALTAYGKLNHALAHLQKSSPDPDTLTAVVLIGQLMSVIFQDIGVEYETEKP